MKSTWSFQKVQNPFSILPILLVTALLFSSGCASGKRSFSSESSPLQSKYMMKASTRYLLYLPDAYHARQNDEWPVVLFLHGAGERGEDLSLVKLHGLPQLIDSGRSFPFIMVAPQASLDQVWEPDRLDALLKGIESEYRIDASRIYVTGLSMGGTGTWNLAISFPERFAAIAPICGRTTPEKAYLIAHLPIWVFHGAVDPIVPVENSVEMVRALRAVGSDVRYTEFPETGHDSWTATYRNPELYSWLLSQQRSEGS